VPDGEYSIERLGRDLLSIIDATSAPRVDLCGVSIGGMTALWVAQHAPDRVRRVVLANTAAKIGDLDTWSTRINTARSEGMSGIADATMMRWFTPEFRAARPEVVSAISLDDRADETQWLCRLLCGACETPIYATSRRPWRARRWS
jgi:pimeloyl-ACP methyl ester carboxylesterase